MDDKTRKQLEKMQAKKDRIAADMARIKARVNQEERKKDTRRKILIGSAMMNLVKTERMKSEKITSMMDSFLTKDRDRELFDLPPVQEADKPFPPPPGEGGGVS